MKSLEILMALGFASSFMFEEDKKRKLKPEDIKIDANNDGLSFEDFKDWFKGYDFSKPMAIIHFTNFRYNQ